jgi:hypothetical protein
LTSREKGIDAFRERHAFGVAQFRIGFGVAVLVTADASRLVPLGEGREDRLPDRSRELEAGALRGAVQHALEFVAVLEDRFREPAYELADRVL